MDGNFLSIVHGNFTSAPKCVSLSIEISRTTLTIFLLYFPLVAATYYMNVLSSHNYLLSVFSVNHLRFPL